MIYSVGESRPGPSPFARASVSRRCLPLVASPALPSDCPRSLLLGGWAPALCSWSPEAGRHHGGKADWPWPGPRPPARSSAPPSPAARPSRSRLGASVSLSVNERLSLRRQGWEVRRSWGLGAEIISRCFSGCSEISEGRHANTFGNKKQGQKTDLGSPPSILLNCK